MMTAPRVAACLLAGASLAAVTAPATAQTAPAQAPAPDAAQANDAASTVGRAGSIDDIVVTARRRAESLQDVPVAVTVIGNEELAERNVVGIDDVARIAPNLQVGQATRGGSVAAVNLRGQENTGQAITNDPAVGIYFDEVYLGRSAGNLLSSLQDMASVQVLRGPQGTLFGRNNTGGAILLTPNRPELEEVSGSITGRYGSHDLFDIGGVANVPLVSGSLGVRASYMRSRRDGIGRSVTTGIDSFGNRHRDSGRLALRWQASDAVVFDLTYDFANIDETGAPWAPLTPNPDLRFYETLAGITDPVNQANVDGFTFRSEVEINPDLSLKAIIGRRFVKTNMQADVDQTPANSVDAKQYADVDQWSAELQLSGTILRNAAPWLREVNFTGGAFYFVEDGEDSSILPLPVGTFLGTGRTLQNLARNESTAAYLQFETNHWDRLFLTFGGRYTQDHRELSIRTAINGDCALAALPPGTPLDLCFQSADSDFSYWSYSLGARYEFSEDANLYLKYDRGQRAGGLDDTPLRIETFQPEVVRSLEAGLKLSAWDRRLRANLAAFSMNIDNLQRTVLLLEPTTNAPYSSVFNAARARVRGIEMELSVRPVDGLELAGSLGLIDPKYTDFVDPLTGADVSHLRFTNTPKTTYSLSASYEAPLGDAANLLARVDWSHRSRINFDVFNDPRAIQKAYGVLGARLQLDLDDTILGAPVSLALFGRNLTDARYNTYATTAAGGQFVRTEDRRTIGVELTLKYH